MVLPFDGLAYAAAQTVRVGSYLSQYALTWRASRLGAPAPGRRRSRRMPRGWLLRELGALMARDWRNIRAGLYPVPHDLVRSPIDVVGATVDYFSDLPMVMERRKRKAGEEVADRQADLSARLPGYYLQNFHYQTDGYLSERSARLYDHQVEVLFGGGADAMRRQALPAIGRHLSKTGSRALKLLDLGTGTGQFPTYVRQAFPDLQLIGLDLSQPYLREARRRFGRRFGPFRGLCAAAEAIPAADSTFDLVTAVFLFHELPKDVRRLVAVEMFRVLAPGGRLVFLDSLQLDDRPKMDPLLHSFPGLFHEPYYADYVRDDLAGMFRGAGLLPVETDFAFLAKLMVFDKPA